jgi:hypothetical protein
MGFRGPKKPQNLLQNIAQNRGMAPPAGARLGPYGNPSDDLMRPVVSSTHEQAEKMNNQSVEVVANPPRHLAPPEGAETLDIRRAVVLTPGSINEEIISFRCPEGAQVFIIDYAVYTDAADASLIDFFPTVDGRRVLAYHGDSNDNYRINLSITDDLSAVALIPCQVILVPGQLFRWGASNNDIVNYTFGVRMKGYFDFGAQLTTAKSGG